MNIKYIINVTTEFKNMFPFDFNYKTISIHDSESSDLYSHFEEMNQFIGKIIHNFLLFYYFFLLFFLYFFYIFFYIIIRLVILLLEYFNFNLI